MIKFVDQLKIHGAFYILESKLEILVISSEDILKIHTYLCFFSYCQGTISLCPSYFISTCKQEICRYNNDYSQYDKRNNDKIVQATF